MLKEAWHHSIKEWNFNWHIKKAPLRFRLLSTQIKTMEKIMKGLLIIMLGVMLFMLSTRAYSKDFTSLDGLKKMEISKEISVLKSFGDLKTKITKSKFNYLV